MERICSDFLTPSGSVLVGAGSIMNLPGNYFFYNSSETPQQADARALYQDFAMVGQDLRDAMSLLASGGTEQMEFQL